MNVREFTVSSYPREFRRCDPDRISRSFRAFLKKPTGFAHFAVKNLR
ncbi:hypothetical protein OA46_14100 [Enterobacter cloacae]|nr:hypothetical protein OA46_14100 [Enterobacter cloacae]